jgi:hypothetical protein
LYLANRLSYSLCAVETASDIDVFKLSLADSDVNRLVLTISEILSDVDASCDCSVDKDSLAFIDSVDKLAFILTNDILALVEAAIKLCNSSFSSSVSVPSTRFSNSIWYLSAILSS